MCVRNCERRVRLCHVGVGTPVAEKLAQCDVAFICYHVGQILIAAAGPFFMGTVTALSQIWFLENERTTATAIATTANAMGTTIGYLNPQWLTLVPSQIPNLFYFSLLNLNKFDLQKKNMGSKNSPCFSQYETNYCYSKSLSTVC